MTSEAFEKEYAGLNAAQKEAVDAIEGPVMVVAGPGSGKTQILSLRVANILLKTDARPGNILCLTFTDSAAANMRKRLVRMIGAEGYRVPIYTFHGFGVDLIERYPEHFYGGATFAPADDLIQIEVLDSILDDLPHDDPLKSIHPEQGYTYLSDIRSLVGSLKKAGIAPDEFAALLDHNEASIKYADETLGSLFGERLSAKVFEKIGEALGKIKSKNIPGFPLPHMRPYLDMLAESLGSALRRAEESGKTEALSKWKADNLEKDDEGNRVLKDGRRLAKLRSLAHVYAEYRTRMHAAGHFDFDDMLLEAIQTIQANDTLRAELQEAYQYVLVDEFQDTNDAQMRLLHLLLDAEVNEGRPNIMVVGDDDQAIYKFQGAELSNILTFRSKYRDPKIVTLTHNYRSTQVILDIARSVIGRGEERLETVVPEIRKDLVAANPEIEKGEIVSRSFPTRAHEHHFVANEIARLISQGEKASDIAVIARKHALLESLIPHLNAAGVHVSYERQSDVLREPHVRQLVAMSKYVASLAREDRREADHLLPEILSFPFWGIPRQAVWKISIASWRERKLWLEAMLDNEDAHIRDIAGFFIGLAEMSLSESAERILDAMIGSHVALAPDTADEDDIAVDVADGSPGASFVSPFRSHYFSSERLKERKGEYLVFLSSLRTFVAAVREHNRGEPLSIDDLVKFVDVHRKNKIAIPDTSPFVAAADAVRLVTAHKAKGLEWKTVFVLNCEDSVWAGRGMGRKITLPLNLPITPAGDTTDDQLRLFYVAISRAKSNLYLTASETGESSKEASVLQFLVPGEADNADVAKHLKFQQGENGISEDVLIPALTPAFSSPLIRDEEAILRELVEDYQMSVTHLNNYLDVRKGGPILFMEQNLIRFPQAKTLSNAYGTAVHSIIERAYRHLREEGGLPGTHLIMEWLARELRRERLSEKEMKELLRRGESSLPKFFAEKGKTFDVGHKIEVNFKNQGACVGDARITGKIDRMVHIAGDEWSVHDWKTGKAVTDWRGTYPDEKVKLYNYRRQIVFYKFLVENSRDFCDRCVVKRGCLEFVEPKDGMFVELALDIEKEEADRIAALIQAVYKKIKNLEFPDTSSYSPDLAGVLAFEEDILEGSV